MIGNGTNGCLGNPRTALGAAGEDRDPGEGRISMGDQDLGEGRRRCRAVQSVQEQWIQVRSGDACSGSHKCDWKAAEASGFIQPLSEGNRLPVTVGDRDRADGSTSAST